MTPRIGVAGWTVPRDIAARFGDGGSHLARYASRLNAVEINSSFYRPHRRTTYERWAASVPKSFRFAVKIPKTITHEQRLIECDALVARFANEVSGLAEKRGPILVQLPPSLAFESRAAGRFFTATHEALGGSIVCEPRHASWFGQEADALLAQLHVARVAADPPVMPAGAEPGGWLGTRYFRLHGAPRMYWSDYSQGAIERHATRLRDLLATGREVWTIFDNTAAGHAPANALALTRACAEGG